MPRNIGKKSIDLRGIMVSMSKVGYVRRMPMSAAEELTIASHASMEMAMFVGSDADRDQRKIRLDRAASFFSFPEGEFHKVVKDVSTVPYFCSMIELHRPVFGQLGLEGQIDAIRGSVGGVTSTMEAVVNEEPVEFSAAVLAYNFLHAASDLIARGQAKFSPPIF